MSEEKHLSILIPSISGRQPQLIKLIKSIEGYCGAYFLSQSFKHNMVITRQEFPFTGIELIVAQDNKETAIGTKRHLLYREASYTYSWQIDDDDAIAPDAIPLILEAMAGEPDCITFEEACTIDGVSKRSNFSLKYADWGDNEDGYDYVRTPFFKTPIKTAICQQVPVPALRFGEDHQWAQLIKPLLQTEVHIDKPLYFYQHTSSPFSERYGFDKENIA